MPLQNGGDTCIVAVERHRCDVVHCPELGALLEDVVQQTEACRLLRLALVVELRRQRLQDNRQVGFPHRRLAQNEDGSGRHRRRGRFKHFEGIARRRV